MDDSSTDDALVAQVRQDANAFAVLYRRHVHRVYSYLMSRVGNAQDAQDLTAQTFLAALKSLSAYTPRDTFSAWLLSIARHKVADHFRSSTAVVPIEDLELEGVSAQGFDELITERLEIDAVVRILSKLNPDRAEALRLHYFGALKQREIAALMGKSEGAVKMLIARALDDIRTMLAVKETLS